MINTYNCAICATCLQFPRYDPIDPEFRPFMDGTYITAHPRDLFVEGRFQRLPTILGTIKDEFGEMYIIDLT